jgi:hypothetical protein
MIPIILPANASLGRCHKDSLNFFSHKSPFMAAACCHASKRTLIASYIMIIVNATDTANRSEANQCFKAIAVVRETTTEE